LRPEFIWCVARTATYAFVNAAMPYILELANQGIQEAIANIPAIERAASANQGKLRHLSYKEG